MGPQNVFHVGGEDEAVQIVLAVLADGSLARIVHGLEEAVAVIEEVSALLVELADQFIVMAQSLVHQLAEALGVLVQHLGALLEGQTLRAVASVVGDMAAGLVAEQVHMHVLLQQVLQQIHHVAVVSDGARLLGGHLLLGDGQRLIQTSGLLADPALRIAGHDAGLVHLGDDGHGSGNFGSLALCAGHAAKACGHEQAACQIAVFGDTQLQSARI